MNADSIRQPHHIASFRMGDAVYFHNIYPQERDQVELSAARTGETILEFTADCYVKNKNGIVGRFSMEKDTWVFYERPLQTRVTCPADKDLLQFEVEISKRYLAKQMSEPATESEGGLTD